MPYYIVKTTQITIVLHCGAFESIPHERVKQIIMDEERCPESAILSITEKPYQHERIV